MTIASKLVPKDVVSKVSNQLVPKDVVDKVGNLVLKDVVGKVRSLVPKDPVNKAKSVLQKVAKPWTITGPAASPEFVEAVSEATEYRKFAPASYPVRPWIPHAEPEHVFNITYFTRDRKRSMKLTTVHEVDPTALAAEHQGDLPPAPGSRKQYVMGKAYHMDDEPGDGYQK